MAVVVDRNSSAEAVELDPWPLALGAEERAELTEEKPLLATEEVEGQMGEPEELFVLFAELVDSVLEQEVDTIQSTVTTRG